MSMEHGPEETKAGEKEILTYPTLPKYCMAIRCRNGFIEGGPTYTGVVLVHVCAEMPQS